MPRPVSTAPAQPFEFDLEALEALPAEERKQEMAKIALFKREIEANPLWSFVPHTGDNGETSWGQHGFLSIDTYMGAYAAGNRAGKTTVGAVHLAIQTLQEQWLPPWLRQYKRWHADGEFVGRVIGVDLPQWLEKAIIPKLRKIIPPAALYKGNFDKAYSDRFRKLRFADGSQWDFLTHDMDLDAYASIALHCAWFDEEPPGQAGKDRFEETLTRLADFDGECRITMTPLLGLSWMYYELTDAHGNPRDDEECQVVGGDIDHNPHLSKDGKKRLIGRWAKKDPAMLAARKRGQWIHFAGLVYEEYRDGPPHVVQDRPIPRAYDDAKPSVPIYAAIDPGINEQHQAALVFAWLDEHDVMEVFYAQKFADLDVAQHAEIYHAVLHRLEFKPRWTIIDPAALNRNPQTGRNLQWAYAQHGIFTLPGQNKRMPGFNEIKNRLRTERLILHAHGAEALRDEFKKYRWKTPKGRTEDAPKPEPIKVNDDCIDALRYLAMSMPTAATQTKSEDEAKDRRQRLVDEDIAHRTVRRRNRRVGSTR